ncbi:hypothetical protein C8J57DRAFT_1318188 [Mycena rebaudengoi]|nr:hypothetical protein C8J57DRAFT_1318188 [Mycena rebaudengoi]
MSSGTTTFRELFDLPPIFGNRPPPGGPPLPVKTTTGPPSLSPSVTDPPETTPKSPITHSATKVTQPSSSEGGVASTAGLLSSSRSSPPSSTRGKSAAGAINIHTDDATHTDTSGLLPTSSGLLPTSSGVLPTSSVPLSSTPPAIIGGKGGANRPPVALIVGLLMGALILMAWVAFFLYRKHRAASAARAVRGRPFPARDMVSGTNGSHDADRASMPPNMRQKGPVPALPPTPQMNDVEPLLPDSRPPDWAPPVNAETMTVPRMADEMRALQMQVMMMAAERQRFFGVQREPNDDDGDAPPEYRSTRATLPTMGTR